jgi:DNA-binding NarL/FixJ family response regulator
MDDNEWVGEAIRRFLMGRRDAEWLGWVDTSQGLRELLRRREPSVLLLDVDIPGEDTNEILGWLRRDHPGVLPIMLSGHVHDAAVERALRAGARGYISKGEPVETIWSLLRRALGASQEQRGDGGPIAGRNLV